MSSCAHTKIQNSKINLVQLQQGLKLQKLLNHRGFQSYQISTVFDIHRSIQPVHKIDARGYLIFLQLLFLYDNLGSRQCSTQNLILYFYCFGTNSNINFHCQQIKTVKIPKQIQYTSVVHVSIWQDFEIQCFIPSSYWQLCTYCTLQGSYAAACENRAQSVITETENVHIKERADQP